MEMSLKNFLRSKLHTQVSLSKHLGIDPSTTCWYLNGYKKIPQKHKNGICNFLQISETKLEKLLENKK